MAFLGAFHVGEQITFRVAWTPEPDSPAITGSTLTLIHEGSGTTGIIEGTPDGTNAYKASTPLALAGRWRASWETEPIGGLTKDTVYAD